MKPLSLRHFLSLAGLSLVSSFFACREATQITLDVTTDALCPGADLDAPRLVDAMFATGKTLDPQDFAAATVTDQCKSGDPNTVGTLVLLPSDSDDLTVEVLVVAGVELAGPSSDIDPLRLSAEGCQALISAGGVGAIQGKPCILVRRRLGFVEHTKLELPIDLDTRCIGKKCGEDQSCFKGNCVSLDLVCDETGCHPPITCEEKCDEFCASGASRCVDTTCECLPCDAETCSAACGLSQQVGVCESDDLCLCKPACDQDACTAECSGECAGATCGCSSCDETACESGGPNCGCQGEPDSCVCVGACEPAACAQQECAAQGFVGACGEVGDQEACICACENTTCDNACEFGGACQATGLCGCNTECVDKNCVAECSIDWKLNQCYQGGCACVCEENLCESFCDGVPGSQGSHCTSADPSGTCDCEVGNPTGGGGSGGDGGNGTTTSTGGFGGDGGNGGGGSTSISTGGFGGDGGTGGTGASTSSSGGIMNQAGGPAAICEAVAANMGAMCAGMCSPYCLSQSCSGGMCAGGICTCF